MLAHEKGDVHEPTHSIRYADRLPGPLQPGESPAVWKRLHMVPFLNVGARQFVNQSVQKVADGSNSNDGWLPGSGSTIKIGAEIMISSWTMPHVI